MPVLAAQDVIISRRMAAVVIAAALLVPSFVSLLLVADDAERVVELRAEATADDLTSSLDYAPMPPASALRSRWISQSVPEVIALGEIATVTFVFRNVGSAPWVRGAAAEARLGVADDDRRFFDLGFALGWPRPDRLAAQTEDQVDVGELGTFTFGLRGAVTGLHHIRVRPVVDGIGWMDDEGAYFDVVVSRRAP